MAIIRTPMIDDDGSGTTGTIFNNAWKQELYNQIDAAAGGTWVSVPFNSTNFGTPSGGATWTVTAPDVQLQKYAVGGNVMQYHVAVAGSVTGVATELHIKMPAGYAINGLLVVPIFTVPNAVGVVVADTPNPGILKITLLNNAAWPPTVNLYVMITLNVTPA